MAVGTWVRLSVIETNTNSTRMQEDTAGGAGGRIRELGVHAPKKAPHVGSHRKPGGAECWQVAILPESRANLTLSIREGLPTTR
jgi:hypothetical protein